jgi:deoxyribonuclease V
MPQDYYQKTIKLQKEVASMVITEDTFDRYLGAICGVDVSYRNGLAYCTAVIMERNDFQILRYTNTISVVKYPYIPGLFMLRESEPILATLSLIKNQFDLLLIDAHGINHPLKCGLASYIGVMTNKPTIGVAKNFLCGCIRKDQIIEMDRVAVGFKLKIENKKPIYVSVGHRISLETAIYTVKQLIRSRERIPEPLRIADIISKKISKIL